MFKEINQQYIPGDHWMICDECGLQYRRSQMFERWDHAWVCKKDLEPRHPQESVRGRADRVNVDYARPPTVDTSNLLNKAADTVGTGWTETAESLYTNDGEQSAPTVTWTGIVTETGLYRIGIQIISTDGNGTVVLTAGGDPITTATISEGVSFVTDTITSTGNAVLTAASSFEGVVMVYLHKIKAQDDL